MAYCLVLDKLGLRSAFHRRWYGTVSLDVVRKFREGEPQAGRGDRCKTSQEQNLRSGRVGRMEPKRRAMSLQLTIQGRRREPASQRSRRRQVGKRMGCCLQEGDEDQDAAIGLAP